MGWRGLGAAEPGPSTRRARTRDSQGLMVKVAESVCRCPCGGFKEAVLTESVTPPLTARLTQGTGCVHVCACVGSPSIRRQRKGLHHLLSLLPTVPTAESGRTLDRQRPTGNHRPIGEGGVL